MQRPGFWDDSETAARVSAQHAATQRRLETFRSLESDVSDLDELVELSADDPELASELESQLGSIEGRLEQLEEARLFNGRVRRGRRGRHGALGRGRHRLAGLGRDAPSHVPALGRAARLPGGDEGGVTRRGGRVEVGHVHRSWGERLRPVRGRAGRASAGTDLALRRAEAPPHRLRPGRRRAARRRRRRGGPRRGGPAGGHVPRLRRRWPARQQDRLRRPRHPRSDRDRGPVRRTSARRRRTRPRR